MAIVRPVLYKNLKIKDYGIDDETGELWSFKKTTPKIVKGSIHIDGYVAVTLADSQFDRSLVKKFSKNFKLHTLVAHTLFDIPIPEGVSEELWEKTDETIKSACREIFQVNHKDHDKSNYRPDNLEFVTASDNIRAALIYYKENLGIKHFGEYSAASLINNKKNYNKFASLESFFG
mgnify:CR=1 FL=1